MTRLTFKFSKLIRHKIVERQLAVGTKPKLRPLSPSEHKAELVNKLIEEAQEITRAAPEDVAAEIADVQQALDDLKSLYGLSSAAIAAVQTAKQRKDGDFKPGLFVEYVDIDETDRWVQYYREHPEHYPEITAPPST